MKIIDLTHPLNPDTPLFPGDSPVTLEHIRTLEKDGFNNFRLSMGLHVGTHLDGPMHMSTYPDTIDKISVDRFGGKARIFDVRGKKRIGIERGMEEIEEDDIVLFCSGMGSCFGQEGYFTDYPDFTMELACWLRDRKVKMVGIDWCSPDHSPYQVHEVLFSADILMLENLCNLEQLVGEETFELYALPLKVSGDSSPVRAIARLV